MTSTLNIPVLGGYTAADLLLDVCVDCHIGATSDTDSDVFLTHHAKLLLPRALVDERSSAEPLTIDALQDAVVVGELNFDIVDAGAIPESACPADVFEQHSAEHERLYWALYENAYLHPTASARKALRGASADGSFLVVTELWVAPGFPAAELGLAAVHTVVRRFARGCAFAAVAAPPKGRTVPALEYAKLGFERVRGGEGLLVRPHAALLPGFAELVAA